MGCLKMYRFCPSVCMYFENENSLLNPQHRNRNASVSYKYSPPFKNGGHETKFIALSFY